MTIFNNIFGGRKDSKLSKKDTIQNGLNLQQTENWIRSNGDFNDAQGVGNGKSITNGGIRAKNRHNSTGRLDSLNTEAGFTDVTDLSDEVPLNRAEWGSKLQYLLTIIGFAVGLGNIWRFPYLCQQNGGGAFLIPYFIMLFLEGIPLFYLELGIGQRIRKGSIGVWNEISPILGGIGIASTMVSFIIGIYYNVIVAWCIYYVFMSLRAKLPWSKCPYILTYVPRILVPPPDTTLTNNAKTIPQKAFLIAQGAAGRPYANSIDVLRTSGMGPANNQPAVLTGYQTTTVASFISSTLGPLLNNSTTNSASESSLLTNAISTLKSTTLYSLLLTSPHSYVGSNNSNNNVLPNLSNTLYNNNNNNNNLFSSNNNNMTRGPTYLITLGTPASHIATPTNLNLLSLLNSSNPLLAHALQTNNVSLLQSLLLSPGGGIASPYQSEGFENSTPVTTIAPYLVRERRLANDVEYTTLDYVDVVNNNEHNYFDNLPIVYESKDPNKTVSELLKYPLKAEQRPIIECELSSATQFFWYRNTLNISPGIDVVDGFNWKIMICLLIAWTVVYLCIMKGIKSSGKASYFTATFPYAVLIILFGRAVSLRGAGLGLKHMFSPKTEKLADPQVWLDAATQIFYSLGLGFGGIIAFSSYNPPRNDCRKDAIIVSLINCFTSVFASLVIFSVLGFKALNNYETCVKINQESIFEYYKGSINKTLIESQYDSYVQQFTNTTSNLQLKKCDLKDNLDQAAEGTGLAFIVFTQAILEFPAPPFWSIIFFAMLITLGFGTMFGMMESILTSIHDLHLFPWLRKEYLAAMICLISFITGLLFCLSSGEYWLKLFDTFAGTVSLVIIAFFELIAVMYVYGHVKFSRDLEFMTGHYPGWYWQLTWRYISPILVLTIFVASVIKWIIKRPEYKSYFAKDAILVNTPYPSWVLAIIAFLILLGSFPIVLIAFLRYFRIIKLDPDIQAGAKRLRTTESTAKILSSTSTLNKLEESDSSNALGAMGTTKPNLETITEIT